MKQGPGSGGGGGGRRGFNKGIEAHFVMEEMCPSRLPLVLQGKREIVCLRRTEGEGQGCKEKEEGRAGSGKLRHTK